MTDTSLAHAITHLPSCADLDKLLNERIEHPERSADLDKTIHESFDKERTVFVLDMSGFSKTVQRYGIIHYLAMIRRMRRVVRPAIESNGGAIVKSEADNVFAVFADPTSAVRAAKDVRHDLDVANIVTADESDIYVCIGIGHGAILLACDDFYGDELNLASKLGEDVAERNEILLTPSARAAITDATMEFEELPVSFGGVTTKMHRVR
ncbi:MAG: adenylate/guanylate cyclase domain-containing protein [Patescibacteria group bacterium]